MDNNSVSIIDSTLREGEQTPGIFFNNSDRLKIISHLHELNIDEIELGTASPKISHLPQLIEEARTITTGSRRLALWCRCKDKDILFAARCKPDVLSLSLPVSDLHITKRLKKDRTWVLETIHASVEKARLLAIPYVSIGFEDSTRADLEFLQQAAERAQSAGAQRIRLADTVGIGSPSTIQHLVHSLKQSTLIDIGVHCHNDFGMATANSIAAVDAGAQWLDATILGLGERAGNCRLEEAMGYLELIKNIKKYRVDLLPKVCRLGARMANKDIPGNHPLIGKDIFTCETGLHQHGLAVDPNTYEPYEPQKVGNERKLLFGKKTGLRAIDLQLNQLGIAMNHRQINTFAEEVREKGAPLNAADLAQFAVEHDHH